MNNREYLAANPEKLAKVAAQGVCDCCAYRDAVPCGDCDEGVSKWLESEHAPETFHDEFYDCESTVDLPKDCGDAGMMSVAHHIRSQMWYERITDSREKLEADIKLEYLEFPGDQQRIFAYLDRQAAITERETLHSHPMCAGRDACPAANRPIGESADRETPDTAGIGASKDEISDSDVWSVAYEIYCAGGYVDNGNEPNPPTDGIRALLDRQAAITEREGREAWHKAASGEIYQANQRAEQILAQNAKLRKNLDAMIGCPGYDAPSHSCRYHAQDFELNDRTVNALKRENAKLQEQIDRILHAPNLSKGVNMQLVEGVEALNERVSDLEAEVEQYELLCQRWEDLYHAVREQRNAMRDRLAELEAGR